MGLGGWCSCRRVCCRPERVPLAGACSRTPQLQAAAPPRPPPRSPFPEASSARTLACAGCSAISASGVFVPAMSRKMAAWSRRRQRARCAGAHVGRW